MTTVKFKVWRARCIGLFGPAGLHSDCRCYPWSGPSSSPAGALPGTPLAGPPPITAESPGPRGGGKVTSSVQLVSRRPTRLPKLSGHVTSFRGGDWWRAGARSPHPLSHRGDDQGTRGEDAGNPPPSSQHLPAPTTISTQGTTFNYWQILMIILGPPTRPTAGHPLRYI